MRFAPVGPHLIFARNFALFPGIGSIRTILALGPFARPFGAALNTLAAAIFASVTAIPAIGPFGTAGSPPLIRTIWTALLAPIWTTLIASFAAALVATVRPALISSFATPFGPRPTVAAAIAATVPAAIAITTPATISPAV